MQNYNLAQQEKEIILEALEHYKGNRTNTAEALGITVRTLRNKLKKYNKSGYLIKRHRQKTA